MIYIKLWHRLDVAGLMQVKEKACPLMHSACIKG